MKLLYVWIDKFLSQHGFVVDDEYYISDDSPDTVDIIYLDDKNHEVIFSGNPSGLLVK